MSNAKFCGRQAGQVNVSHYTYPYDTHMTLKESKNKSQKADREKTVKETHERRGRPNKNLALSLHCPQPFLLAIRNLSSHDVRKQSNHFVDSHSPWLLPRYTA